MTLPTAVAAYFETIAEPFGGYELLLEAVSESTLNYIATYPGFVLITKPWAEPLDLTTYGYQAGSSYRVYNSRFQHLYSHTPADNTFGAYTLDQQALLGTPHGDYLHIYFQTADSATLGLLWVANQLTYSQRKQVVNTWLTQRNLGTRRLVNNEVYLKTTNLYPAGTVKVYYLPGFYVEAVTDDYIINNTSTIQTNHLVVNNEVVIPLNPYQNGWLLIKHDTGAETFDLELANKTGVNAQRISRLRRGLHFIQLNNTNVLGPIAQPQTSLQQLIDSSQINMRVEADLRYVFSLVATGSSTATGGNPTFVGPAVTVKGTSRAAAIGQYPITTSVLPLESDIMASEVFGNSENLSLDSLETDVFYASFGPTDIQPFVNVAIARGTSRATSTAED